MSPADLRWLTRVHGALAWAATFALVGALGLVWKRRASATWATGMAGALGLGAFGTGLAMHAPFQSKLRQKLFLASETLGWLFERKEHAAFGGLALGLSAVFAVLGSRALGARDAAATASLRRASLLALGAALVLDVVALVVSILASRRVSWP